jgi:cellulose synthase/poly-beta-1,6-N-acetylglucosamine synthase-like glycosyltransferase
MPRDPLEPTVLPKISAVICTFNRHDLLLEAIMSIELQDLPAHDYELIIVDNSDDLAAREQFRDGLQITCAHRYIDEARPGLSRARNIGIQAARGELVAFLDDDAKACTGWLRHIIKAFAKHEEAGVVGGPVRPIWAARPPAWLTPQLQSFLTVIDRGDEARLLAEEEWLSGTNIAFRTRAVTEAGLFPENLGRIRSLLLSNEELLVTKRIRDLGYTVLYDPKVEMHHRVHPERVSQCWLRRRVFWQVLSDLFIDEQPQKPRAEDDIQRILDFLMKLAPRHRGAMGLFVDTDDPILLVAQTEAIGALAWLLATDCGDWRGFLAGRG